MAASWFYSEEGRQRGPVTLDELLAALPTLRDPHRVLVWNEGMTGWQQAGLVEELRSRLPPPLSSVAGTPELFTQAEAIVRYYRRLVLLVGLQILVPFVQAAFVPFLSRRTSAVGFLPEILLVGVFILSVALAVTAYQLVQCMGEGVPLVWAIAMFVPCVSIIMLLVLSGRAQTWCRRVGVKVGFLGPTRESIEELRKRTMTSHFE
jgi:hypothetical protein